MSKERDTRVGILLDETIEFSLNELCHVCRVHSEVIVELVEVGVVEPRGQEPAKWRFPGSALRRMQRAVRLQHDLGINAAGVALALDLLDEIERLRDHLGTLEGPPTR
ncbi:MAG: chaperone modulator CbpM [Gammaproteobacteria bacterium]|jgi:chaperone modulatory protein CbpM